MKRFILGLILGAALAMWLSGRLRDYMERSMEVETPLHPPASKE